MNSLIRITLVLLALTLSFELSNAVESDGSPSVDQTDGQIDANTLVQMTGLINQAVATQKKIEDIVDEVGRINDSSDEIRDLVRALGEKADFAQAKVEDMQAKNAQMMKSTDETLFGQLSQQIRQDATDVDQLYQEALALKNRYSPSLE